MEVLLYLGLKLIKNKTLGMYFTGSTSLQTTDC